MVYQAAGTVFVNVGFSPSGLEYARVGISLNTKRVKLNDMGVRINLN